MTGGVSRADIRFRLPLALVGLLLSGCVSEDRTLVGEWKGYRPMPAMEDDTMRRNLAAVKLSLKPDGTFEVQDGGIPFTGRWRMEGERVILEVEMVMNRRLADQPASLQKAAAFSASRVGKELAFSDLSDSSPIRLQRLP